MKTVIYPGTFDPITNGHVDLVETLAKTIADDLLSRFPIQRLCVRIEKPDAIHEAESVGIEIERLRIST